MAVGPGRLVENQGHLPLKNGLLRIYEKISSFSLCQKAIALKMKFLPSNRKVFSLSILYTEKSCSKMVHLCS